MNSGKVFEQQFSKYVPDGFYRLRLPDSATSFGQDSKAVRFSRKSPYDYLLYHNPFLYCLELKTTKETSLSFEREEPKTKKNKKEIHYHQILELDKASKYKGVIAGFLFDFRKGNTYFLSIEQFLKFMNDTDKKSINEDDCIKYEAIIVEKRLLKVNYKYNLKKLFETLEVNKNGTLNSLQ